MPRDKRSCSLTISLLVWLTPQLLSLLLSAGRVPLSAHPPRPVESIAAEQMLSVQIVVAGAFAPVLFRSLAGIVAVILTAAPMLQLAGFLSSIPPGKMAALYALSASWAVGVGTVCVVLCARHRLWIGALATTYALGGLALAYLHAEFAPDRSVPDAVFGPAYLAIQFSQSSHITPLQWVYVATIPTLGVVIAYGARAVRRFNPSQSGQVEGSGSPPPSI
jgi:hypothetical protein